MPISMLDTVNFNKIAALNFVVPVVTSDPTATSADEGRVIYNTTTDQLKYCDGTPAWVALGPAGAGGPPSGDAGGDLTGSYPNPTILADAITNTKLANMATNTIKGNNTGSTADPKDLTVSETKTLLALNNVDNTSDANKPISTATQTALDLKVDETVDLTAGNGLTGGGTLSISRSFAVGAGTGILSNANDVAIDRTTVDTWYVDVGGDTLTGYLVTHADPVSDLQVANKRYVDLARQGFSFKEAVRVVSTTNRALSGLAAIDGVTPSANDRVLLAGQSAAAENGIWLAASGAWTRATDMDASGELKDGTLVPVGEGTTNADSQWLCTTIAASPWVPGSTSSTWTRQYSLSDLTAGAGMTKTGNQLDVVSATGDMTVGADSITINSAPKWTTSRTLNLTGDVTGSVSFDGSAAIGNLATTVVNAGKHYSTDVGNGSSTSITVTHNLGTRDLNVSVYTNSGTYAVVSCGIEMTTTNTVTLNFATAPASNAYRCTIHG